MKTLCNLKIFKTIFFSAKDIKVEVKSLKFFFLGKYKQGAKIAFMCS